MGSDKSKPLLQYIAYLSFLYTLQRMNHQGLFSLSPRIDDIECAGATMIQPRHPGKDADSVTGGDSVGLEYRKSNLLGMIFGLYALRKVNI